MYRYVTFISNLPSFQFICLHDKWNVIIHSVWLSAKQGYDYGFTLIFPAKGSQLPE